MIAEHNFVFEIPDIVVFTMLLVKNVWFFNHLFCQAYSFAI